MSIGAINWHLTVDALILSIHDSIWLLVIYRTCTCTTELVNNITLSITQILNIFPSILSTTKHQTFCEVQLSANQSNLIELVKHNHTCINNEEAFSSRNTQKKNFLSPQRESNPWPSRYQLDCLTTELWETRGEQGHIVGSYMCDVCHVILQASTCRNDKCKHLSW